MEELLVSNGAAIELDLLRPGKTIFIVFGGINQGVGIPVFEFKGIAKEIEAKFIYVRDVSQTWYQGLHPGVGGGVYKLKNRLVEIINENKGHRLVCIGNSMGGYAALVFGSLLSADRVLSFAPQTFINVWHRFIYSDKRWRKKIVKARSLPSAAPDTFELRSFLKNAGYREALVYFDPAHRLDARHAKRLELLPNTRLITLDGGHGVIRVLKERGELQKLLQESIYL